MNKTLKLGIVGFGHRGRNMFKLCADAFSGIEPVAICEKQAHLLDKARSEFSGCTLYDDYECMLKNAGLDVVLVETPADNHAKFCALALEAGINVFSDIPSVASLEEADMLWRADQNSEAMFMTGANPNFWGFVGEMAKLHENGMFGKPVYLEAEYIHDVQALFDESPWRRTYPPIKYCTHSLGPLLRVLKEDLKYVSCFTTGSHINNYPGQHDMMTAHFRTESGVVVRLTCSFVNNAHIGHHSYRLFGTDGYFERNGGRGECIKPVVLYSSNKNEDPQALIELPVDMMPPEYAGKPEAQGHGGADYAMLDVFFNALINGEPSPVSLKEGLRMTIPGIFAAESAMCDGEVLEITYPWNK